MPNGSYASIEHCEVYPAHKTLGTMACPSGKCNGMINSMKAQAQGWIDQVILAKMTR
jgi:hypothetical protein